MSKSKFAKYSIVQILLKPQLFAKTLFVWQAPHNISIMGSGQATLCHYPYKQATSMRVESAIRSLCANSNWEMCNANTSKTLMSLHQWRTWIYLNPWENRMNKGILGQVLGQNISQKVALSSMGCWFLPRSLPNGFLTVFQQLLIPIHGARGRYI